MYIMKKFIFLLVFTTSITTLSAQEKWFHLYTDSVALMKDANEISNRFVADVKKIRPDISFSPKIVLNTTPSLIYFNDADNSVNLPLWEQVIIPIREFMYTMAGDEAGGQRMFGLFFNGFYLPHELGHGLAHATGKAVPGSYADEYTANIIAMLWSRKHGRQAELEQCYQLTRKMYAMLPNPAPAGQTVEQYFTENYAQATQDPSVYGYMQFGQFIKIYEDKSLPDFDTFIRQFIPGK